MKKLAASLIAFFVVGCASVATSPAPAVIAEASQAVVAIEFEPESPDAKGRTHCSGTVYAPGKILTNAHCTSLDDNRRYIIRFKDDSVAIGYLVGRAKDIDAAIISVDPRATKHFVRIAKRAPVAGERVFVVGHPAGLRWSVTVGVVSNAERILNTGEELYDKPTWYQVDAAINPGNSGGALFNADGELLGVPTLKYRDVDNIGFALRIADVLAGVKDFLQ